MIIHSSFFIDSIDSLGGRFSNLLRANNEGDGHQDQAVPHVQHQANLVEDSNDDGDNKKDKDDDMGTPLMMMMMADLNKEDEDNAEPPELHCCKHCAKDVALHNVVFVSF